MNLLSTSDSAALRDLLVNNLPHVVLDSLCRASITGATLGGLVRDLMHYLPSTVAPDVVRDHTQASLYWYLFNGDIAGAGGQRYRIMPTYAVALPLDYSQASGDLQIQICGDPRRDNAIQKALTQIGAQWTSETVVRTWMIAGEYRDVPVGRRRRVITGVDGSALTENYLQRMKIPVLDIQRLEQSLPSVAELTVPPRDAFRSIAPTSGFWLWYAPAQTLSNRWELLDSWNEVPTGLLRWMPSRDWRGERDSRYFYKDTFPEMAELSHSIACLWMFHLDQKLQRRRQLWHYGGELWLPSTIPDIHRQWLQLLSERIRWREHLLHCLLSVDSESVVRTLVSTLGLQPIHNRPE